VRARLVTIVLAAIVSGCVGGTPGNPNLAAPKLIVESRADGNVTVFVHGAFREQSYAWLSLALDNHTITNRTNAFSIEEVVPGPGFFLDLTALAGVQYEMRARVDLNQTGERVRVSLLDANGWTEAKVYGVPYEHLLDHVKVTS
jgi:hypothetical protein